MMLLAAVWMLEYLGKEFTGLGLVKFSFAKKAFTVRLKKLFNLSPHAIKILLGLFHVRS